MDVFYGGVAKSDENERGSNIPKNGRLLCMTVKFLRVLQFYLFIYCGVEHFHLSSNFWFVFWIFSEILNEFQEHWENNFLNSTLCRVYFTGPEKVSIFKSIRLNSLSKRTHSSLHQRHILIFIQKMFTLAV